MMKHRMTLLAITRLENGGSLYLSDSHLNGVFDVLSFYEGFNYSHKNCVQPNSDKI